MGKDGGGLQVWISRGNCGKQLTVVMLFFRGDRRSPRTGRQHRRWRRGGRERQKDAPRGRRPKKRCGGNLFFSAAPGCNARPPDPTPDEKPAGGRALQPGARARKGAPPRSQPQPAPGRVGRAPARRREVPRAKPGADAQPPRTPNAKEQRSPARRPNQNPRARRPRPRPRHAGAHGRRSPGREARTNPRAGASKPGTALPPARSAFIAQNPRPSRAKRA